MKCFYCSVWFHTVVGEPLTEDFLCHNSINFIKSGFCFASTTIFQNPPFCHQNTLAYIETLWNASSSSYVNLLPFWTASNILQTKQINDTIFRLSIYLLLFQLSYTLVDFSHISLDYNSNNKPMTVAYQPGEPAIKAIRMSRYWV